MPLWWFFLSFLFFFYQRQGWNFAAESLACIICYLCVRWDVNLSDLPGAAQRAEFNAGGTPRGQAGGGPSWGAPASHHLHTSWWPSLPGYELHPPPPLPPPPPQHPLTSANPPLTLPRPPPLFCCDKTHLLPGRIPLPLLVSASDLSVKAAWILCDGDTVASAANPVFI